MNPASLAQITMQRAFLSSHCTPITSPTFKSFSTPETRAPSELTFCARACWEKGRPSAFMPHTRTGRSTVRRGSVRCSAMLDPFNWHDNSAVGESAILQNLGGRSQKGTVSGNDCCREICFRRLLAKLTVADNPDLLLFQKLAKLR